MKLRLLVIILLFAGGCLRTQAIHAQDVDGGDLYLVRSLFLDTMGSSRQSTRFRSLLGRKLAANGFEIAKTMENADAVITGSVLVDLEKHFDDRFLMTKVALRLRSKRGRELWSGNYSSGRNLRFGHKDLILEFATEIAKSLREAKQSSLRSSRDGRVEHVFLVWKPEDTPLNVSGGPAGITDEELSKLKALGLKGQLRVAHTGIEGIGPSKTRLIIVMDRQPSDYAEFSLSGQSEIVVVQMGETWLTDPSRLPFSKSKLKIFPITFDETGVTLDRENSGIQFQFAFKWSNQ